MLAGTDARNGGESAAREGTEGGSGHEDLASLARFSSHAILLRLFLRLLLGRTCFFVTLDTATVECSSTPPALQRKEMVSTPFLHSSTHLAHVPLSKHWR